MDTTQIPVHSKPGRRRLILLGGVALAIAGAVVLRDRISFEALATHRDALIAFRDAHYLAAAAAFMAIYIVIVTFSLPGATIATLSGGFLFGLFPGVLYNVTAATIGACCLFLAVRWGLGDFLTARISQSAGTVKRIQDEIRANEIPVLLLMRLVPAVPFFVANLIPALIGVRLSRFAATTFVGIIPGGLVYTWVGAGLDEVFASGAAPNLGILFEPQVIGPIIGLCVLAALPILINLLRKKRGT